MTNGAERVRRSWVLVAAAMAALGWGGNQFIPLMVLYRQAAGFTQLEVDLLLAVYVIGIVPGFLVAGAWSDRWGRKRIMLGGIALGAAASLVFALAGTNLAGLSVARFLSGISVAVAMVVGSSWIKELSDIGHGGMGGARRSSIALSVGFGGGAAIGGILAQWAPLPTLLPYVVHATVTLVALVGVTRVSETRTGDHDVTSLIGDVRIPVPYRRLFRGTVAPIAPFIFGSCALAFAVGPSLVADQTRDLGIAFATLVMILTLAVGTATQLASAAIDRMLRGRSGPAGAALFTVGALVLIPAVVTGNIWPVLAAAPLLGAAYGLCMVSGLSAVQSMATPDDLAGITSQFYTLSYTGFFLPMIIAALAPITGTISLLIAVAVIALICAIVAVRSRNAARPSEHAPQL